MNKKLNIAFFITNLGQGGAEKQFLNLIKYLNPEIFNKKLYLYAYQDPAFYQEVFEFENVKVITNRLRSKFSVLKIIEAGLYIRKVTKIGNYDIIVSTLYLNNFLVRLFTPRRYKNRCIANVRTSFKLYSKIHKLGERLQIKNSQLVFNSYNAMKHFKNIFPPRFENRMHVIYNGFSIPKPIGQISSLVFGCLGRLNEEKNFIQVVKAFQLFENCYPNSKLIIQGNQGNQYSQIAGLISSKNIELRNQNTNIDIFFHSIRILIIPSFFEGCPNVLFESLLRKRLCVISIGANSDNFITDGYNGFIYDGSDEGLLTALEKVSNILDTINETMMIENGYTYAKENFSIETMVTNYEKLFLKIYEENKSCN